MRLIREIRNIAAALVAFAVNIIPTTLLYGFFITVYQSRDAGWIYDMFGVFNTLLFWIFPFVATIIFSYLGREVTKSRLFCIASFIAMYTSVFIYAATTAGEFRLSHNIFEGEIAFFHVLVFLAGLVACWFFGDKVAARAAVIAERSQR